ncbi:MAG TPA: M56 family metallopeptidase [Candidatus Acidoferrum sp.]|nr:M56 family metallopeptidase [Candidatus Acidoferrum sp.]
MTLPMDWISAETLRLLALSLLHFLWQGAALAALAYLAMAVCRNASAKYVTGVVTLALMLTAPVATFLVFRSQERAVESADVTVLAMTNSKSGDAVRMVSSAKNQNTPAPSKHESTLPYFQWLVEFWFAGVVLLSLRSAGGILLVERLRRRESLPVTNDVMELCQSLQQRMGLTRAVRYCESLHLDAPAVAGWLRPVVLLPVSALSGLSTAQLEAVIAHELAHIRRYDAFVNLFQVGIETLLFYHPAVWWLGKRVRAERENCCDDVAVALCGSPVTYAHALTRLAESKAAPQLAMAVNRSPLVERIARLLGANRTAESFRGANLSAGVLCLSAALLAGSALVGSVHRAQAQTPAPAAPAAPAAPTVAAVVADTPRIAEIHAHVPQVPDVQIPEVAAPAQAPTPAAPVAAPTPAPAPAPAPVATPRPAPVVRYSWSLGTAHGSGMSWSASASASSSGASWSQGSSGSAAAQSASDASKQSYIDSISAAGLTNLTVDELIDLKVQGVTADYIKSVRDMNIKVDVDTIVSLKVQGVTADYIKGMRSATGQNLDADDLVGMKVQGITPEYIKEMHDLGLKTDADDVIAMKVQGITPEYLKQMRDLGLKTDTDDLIGMKVQGITPEYVKQMRDLGLKTDTDDLIAMKVQGITPEYVREMRSIGLKVDSDDLVGMKVQGITPEYVKGFNDMGMHPGTDDLIGMKVQGVTPAYIKELQAQGFKVDVDDAIGAKVQGITPEFIAKVKSHGFKDLTLDKLIALKNTGVLDPEK